MRTLLAIFAHPDDEVFGPGGTLAKYASQDVSVHLVCATRGGAGESRLPEALTHEGLARQREKELQCAASVLGLAGVHILGYRDSGMSGSASNEHPEALARARTEEVAEGIASIMQRLRPQVVLTFGPDGGYGHPDHVAVHSATLAAWDKVCERTSPELQPHKLYYMSFLHRMLRWAIRVMPLLGIDAKRLGANGDIDLHRILAHGSPVTARVDVRQYVSVKQRAAACHASQTSGWHTLAGRLSAGIAPRLMGTETFHRAVPAVGVSEAVEQDLFAGLPQD